MITNKPRPVRHWDKKALRELLKTPIAAYKFKQGRDGEKMKGEEIAARIKAAFALYDIPEDWPELDRWHQLAMCLLGAHFPGCKVLSKGRGGPGEARREKQRDLFREFLAEEAKATIKGKPARMRFLNRNNKRCAELGFTTERSFSQALAKFQKRWPDAVFVKLSSSTRAPK
jgi:hypothetical protein